LRDGFRWTSLGEQVANALKNQILMGDVAPRSILREVELAEAFGVSRNTVREALRMIEGEDLIKYTPHKGVMVTQLTKAEIEDLYRVRLFVETAAARVASTATPEMTMKIQDSFNRFVSACEADDITRFVQADLDFHSAIVHLTGSRMLFDFHTGICAKLCRAIIATPKAREEMKRPDPLIFEHRTLMEAVMSKDAEGAVRLLEIHIQTHGETALNLFS